MRSSWPAASAARALPSRQPPQPQLPARIEPRYEVLARLGRGGMAVVYRVRDLSHGAPLALKQLAVDRNTPKGREAEALFEREFRTLAQLTHPNLVQVYDYGLDAGGPYYTMDLLEGGELAKRAPLPFSEACAIAVRICSALSLLHSRRLLHRDVTPRNIHCTRDGGVKLIDFGAMVPMGRGGQIIGTPAFVAPEVLYQLSLDARTDLYSLGATLYYALTRQRPFAARSFTELQEAWLAAPPPVSHFAPDVPPALDALVAALISPDPARRPGSAFEVMQRLAVIAGIEAHEPLSIAQACLATPMLVGREREQELFEQTLRGALDGRGAAVSFEATPGLGRSRLLDTCILKAKTLGASVLRLEGAVTTGDDLAGAHALTSQLCELLPSATQAAALGGSCRALFDASAEPQLLPRSAWRAERAELIQALCELYEAVSQTQPLLIAVDDAERLDEASLALLAALADRSGSLRLMIAITLGLPLWPGAVPSLDVLRAQCAARQLAPLSPVQLEALFSSVFGSVPHVQLLSDRIQQITGGNPAESMALAQLLLDRRQLRYTAGSWTLPAELSVNDLPASIEEALSLRLAALAPLARKLLETQALALPGPWTRADYLSVAGNTEAEHVDEALDALLWLGLVTGDRATFWLGEHRVRAHLVAQLSAAERAERHAALAARAASADTPGLAEIHHLLHAGALELALERFATLVPKLVDTREDFWLQPGVAASLAAEIVERAYHASLALGRPLRERMELARHLVILSITADSELHHRYGPVWLAQLQRDSGLTDYRAASHVADPVARIAHAFERTLARSDATPARQRVYRTEEAIGHLARYVTFSIAIGARTRDNQLLGSLPELIEPFVGLSSVLHALWQNAISAAEMNYLGRTARARQRAREVYDRLSEFRGEELRYVDRIRYAVANALSTIEIGLGLPSAERWIEILDADPLQRVNGLYLRRLLCIENGDPEGAERYRKQAEVLAVRAGARQVFLPPLRIEIVVQFRAGDLAGLKQVADRVARLAADAPGWIPQQHLAEACYQRLRGDMPLARRALERCLAAANPGPGEPLFCHNTWAAAAAGYIAVLSELAQPEQAREFGHAALARCDALEIDTMHDEIERELALAEAGCGDFIGAVRRVDALIEKRSGLVDAHRALDYEARARIAITEGDTAATEHYLRLAGVGRFGYTSLAPASHARLLDDDPGPTATPTELAGDTTAVGSLRRERQRQATGPLTQDLSSDRSEPD